MASTDDLCEIKVVLVGRGPDGRMRDLTPPRPVRFRLYAHDIRPAGGERAKRAQGRVWLSDAFLPVRYSDGADARLFWRALGIGAEDFARRRKTGIIRFAITEIDGRDGRPPILIAEDFMVARSEEEAKALRAAKKGDGRHVYVLADPEFQQRDYASQPDDAYAHAAAENPALPSMTGLLPPSPEAAGMPDYAQYLGSEHARFDRNHFPFVGRMSAEERLALAYRNYGWPADKTSCAQCGSPIELVRRRWRKADIGIYTSEGPAGSSAVFLTAAACSRYGSRLALRNPFSGDAFPDWASGHDLAVAGWTHSGGIDFSYEKEARPIEPPLESELVFAEREKTHI